MNVTFGIELSYAPSGLLSFDAIPRATLRFALGFLILLLWSTLSELDSAPTVQAPNAVPSRPIASTGHPQSASSASSISAAVEGCR